MATTNSGKSPESGFTPNLEEAADRIRDLNEKMITASKQSGNVTLDAYEKTLKGLLDFQEKSASATQLDWVQAIAKAHATYITDVSKAFTSAARDALK
ncbi:hypothetical protein [Ornithinimicrobium cryptoxanthini]|uniref:Uncharacterized protein n=1 Tax=Ornithinimicrobium cryptoxanthini TaxID=2934161 RepID=A0ABY4YN28_9MICO|nr:hypothetical protein [Ornithinimicrobium cryptoxanthini]USQ77748.1 hypothetical protein NF557_07580 [Ornithinimicrobium cryptoxanthini]